MTARARAGFTLLEIAVALAILGVGVVTCLEIFSASLRIQDRASRESRAVLAGRAAMDALLFQPEISDHSECRPSAEGYKTCVEVRHAGPQDGVEIDDSDMGIASDVSLRYLQVDVYWQDGTGAKTYTLKSLRAAPEDE
jgi:prepilin-type N-terminal cleavage/methylation domain-containing protein